MAKFSLNKNIEKLEKKGERLRSAKEALAVRRQRTSEMLSRGWHSAQDIGDIAMKSVYPIKDFDIDGPPDDAPEEFDIKPKNYEDS